MADSDFCFLCTFFLFFSFNFNFNFNFHGPFFSFFTLQSGKASKAKPGKKAPLGSSRGGSNNDGGQTVEQRYQKKTQLEHILLRPDTYSEYIQVGRLGGYCCLVRSTSYVHIPIRRLRCIVFSRIHENQVLLYEVRSTSDNYGGGNDKK